MKHRAIERLVVVLALLPLAAFAADPPPATNSPVPAKADSAKPSQTLQTVYVTGSHIRNVDLEMRHPVLVLARCQRRCFPR